VPRRYNQGVEVQPQSFLTLALDGSKSSASPSCYFTLGESSGILTRRLGGLQSWSEYFNQKSLLFLLTFKPIIIPSIAQTLYQLSYPSSSLHNKTVRVIPVHITNACGLSGGTAHSELIRALSRSGQLQAPATSLPVNRGLGGPQSHSGHAGDKKNLLPLQGFEPRTIQPVP